MYIHIYIYICSDATDVWLFLWGYGFIKLEISRSTLHSVLPTSC